MRLSKISKNDVQFKVPTSVPESKITEIYCMADDFCKEFALQQEKYMVEDSKQKHQFCRLHSFTCLP